uniref:Ribosome maturation protein SBDS n=1 Tax=Meloidogyne javanica TaxID=6303 RepID=A0A915MJV7_MELJA
MPGQIKTPTNQKLLTNVAIVRLKKCGKRFEIACYKNKKNIDEVLQTQNVFVNVARGQLAKRDDLVECFETDNQLGICKTKNIDEVLQTQNVFVNVARGQLAKRDDLVECFETYNQLEICKTGDLQVSDKERQLTSESSFKTIENALRDAHFSLKSNHSAKQQALEMIPKIRENLKIDRAKMRVRVSVLAKHAKSIHGKLKAFFETVEVEDWEKGNLEMVGLIEPGNYKTIAELLKGDKKEKIEQIGLELLSLKANI